MLSTALEVSWQRLLEGMAQAAAGASSVLKERGNMSSKHCGMSSISSPIC